MPSRPCHPPRVGFVPRDRRRDPRLLARRDRVAPAVFEIGHSLPRWSV